MKKKILVKIGGKAASARKALEDLIQEMTTLQNTCDFILVHGGGAEVSRVTKIFGIEPVFKDGIRMTSEAEMEIVDMVLAGKMNKSLVRLFETHGMKAVGISGSDGRLFTGASIEAGASQTGRGNRTGSVTRVDTRIIDLLSGAGYLPVIASVSMDEAGEGLNINADEAALEIAKSAKADGLVFLSDIPGILKNGEVLKSLDEASANREIEAGVITGGMIPKVKSSLGALGAGVGFVVIGDFTASGDLTGLLSKDRGTTMHRSEN